MCALAVLLSFIGLWLLFERYWLALAGSLLFGLLPQLAFIASYTNDDSGAIFSATALVFAMILVLRKGLSGRSSIVFGISTGLVLLSKFTAWLLLPLAAGFLVPYLWRSRRFGANYMAAIAVAAVVGGGWWILFNIYNYGIDDPVLTQVSTRLSEQRAVLQDAGNRGYVSRGVGLSELILHNYKNFHRRNIQGDGRTSGLAANQAGLAAVCPVCADIRDRVYLSAVQAGAGVDRNVKPL